MAKAVPYIPEACVVIKPEEEKVILLLNQSI